MRRVLTVPVLAVAVASSALRAQVSPEPTEPPPYSRLRIRLSGARNVNRDALHDFWRAGTGGGLAVTTPFYVGSVGVGATLIPFRARESGRPNFRALLVGLDWGVDIPAPGPLRARAAARVGDFVMLIENPDLWLDSESELFVGGELSAGYALRRDLAVTVAGSFARVHTRPSLDLALVTVGLEYATHTPGWLRAVLE
ncbi:MAG: hypothetical protein ABR499_13595 [Gemmatimonadaceae bacterium]